MKTLIIGTMQNLDGMMVHLPRPCHPSRRHCITRLWGLGRRGKRDAKMIEAVSFQIALIACCPTFGLIGALTVESIDDLEMIGPQEA